MVFIHLKSLGLMSSTLHGQASTSDKVCNRRLSNSHAQVLHYLLENKSIFVNCRSHEDV